MKTSKVYHTDIPALALRFSGNRLCFVVSNYSSGKKRNFWVDLPPMALRAVQELIESDEEETRRMEQMSPEELREHYQEYGGS